LEQGAAANLNRMGGVGQQFVFVFSRKPVSELHDEISISLRAVQLRALWQEFLLMANKIVCAMQQFEEVI
jgi:hypothetical protein